MDFLENRDIVSQSSLTASCMAAMSGHSDVDIQKMSGDVAELVSKLFDSRFPYIIPQEEKEEENQYDYYFKLLDEIEKEKKEKAEKTEKDKNQEHK